MLNRRQATTLMKTESVIFLLIEINIGLQLFKVGIKVAVAVAIL